MYICIYLWMYSVCVCMYVRLPQINGPFLLGTAGKSQINYIIMHMYKTVFVNFCLRELPSNYFRVISAVNKFYGLGEARKPAGT